MEGERELARKLQAGAKKTKTRTPTITAVYITSIVLAVFTHSSSSDVIAIGEWVGRGIVDAACCVTVTVTQLAREAIACGAIAPRFVIVEWCTLFAVISLGVVYTLTDGVDRCTAATRMSIARTPAIKSRVMIGQCETLERCISLELRLSVSDLVL